MDSSIPYPEWRQTLVEGAAHFGLTLTDQQIRRCYRHAEILHQWNRSTNLTAITDAHSMAVKHFLDAFGPAAYVTPMTRVLDVGSGGGFPGLPLKVWCPSIDLTLVDRQRKKVSFLRYVIRALEMSNARALQIRVEDLARQCDRPLFDTIVCRAFGGLAFMVSHLPPLLAAGGRIVVWKGRLPEQEIREVQPLLQTAKRALTLSVRSYRLPFSDAERTLVILTDDRCGAKEFQR